MKLQITKIETSTKEVEIQVPSFSRNKEETEYLGILDDQTVLYFYQSGDLTQISHGTPDTHKSRIETSQKEYFSCTETEFLTAYDNLLESINLHPILKS